MKRINRWIFNLVQYLVLNHLSEWNCRTIYEKRMKKDGKIAIYWGTTDVIHTAINNYKVLLTEKQAMEILSIAENKHDANEGINWVSLDVWIDYYIREHKLESDPDICICSECQAILTSSDEAYEDEQTSEPLCDSCSETNEVSGNYRKAKK